MPCTQAANTPRAHPSSCVHPLPDCHWRTLLVLVLLPKNAPALPPLLPDAGIQYVSPVEEFPEDKWDDIIAVCLNSAFHATKAALPYMLQQGWGRIVNTGSMHALVASPYKSAYNAAKHGIAGFTKTVALEMAQKNITCNAICPGYVLTGVGPWTTGVAVAISCRKCTATHTPHAAAVLAGALIGRLTSTCVLALLASSRRPRPYFWQGARQLLPRKLPCPTALFAVLCCVPVFDRTQTLSRTSCRTQHACVE